LKEWQNWGVLKQSRYFFNKLALQIVDGGGGLLQYIVVRGSFVEYWNTRKLDDVQGFEIFEILI